MMPSSPKESDIETCITRLSRMRTANRMQALEKMTREELEEILTYATPDLFAPVSPCFPCSVRTSIAQALRKRTHTEHAQGELVP